MNFYPRLYVGDSVQNPDKFIRKLKKHPKLMRSYVLLLSGSPVDQLEIIKAGFLSQKYYRERELYVIGIAGNYEEAVSLVKKIAEEAFAQNGNCNLKEYLQCCM